MGQEHAEWTDSWVTAVGVIKCTTVIVKHCVELGFCVASLEVVLVIFGLGKLLDGYLLLGFQIKTQPHDCAPTFAQETNFLISLRRPRVRSIAFYFICCQIGINWLLKLCSTITVAHVGLTSSAVCAHRWILRQRLIQANLPLSCIWRPTRFSSLWAHRIIFTWSNASVLGWIVLTQP